MQDTPAVPMGLRITLLHFNDLKNVCAMVNSLAGMDASDWRCMLRRAAAACFGCEQYRLVDEEFDLLEGALRRCVRDKYVGHVTLADGAVYALVPLSVRARRCFYDQCTAADPQVYCDACVRAVYCSVACLRADAKQHETECRDAMSMIQCVAGRSVRELAKKRVECSITVQPVNSGASSADSDSPARPADSLWRVRACRIL